MNKKPKCDACSTGWCKNHVFELNPNSANLYYRKNFKIRLCPRLNKSRLYYTGKNTHSKRLYPYLIRIFDITLLPLF